MRGWVAEILTTKLSVTSSNGSEFWSVYLQLNKEFVLKTGESSNGRTEAFEAFNRGSNPCTPANENPP